MKIKPQVFTAVTAGVFVITILTYILSLVVDFKKQSVSSEKKFESISANLEENIKENDIHSNQFYGHLIESCGDGKEIKFLQVIDNEEPVFTFPAESEITASKFQFTKTHTKKITVPEKETVTLVATLYTIKATSFYNKSLAAFLIILAATIACVLYLIFLSVEDSENDQENDQEENYSNSYNEEEEDNFVVGETVPEKVEETNNNQSYEDDEQTSSENSSFDFAPIMNRPKSDCTTSNYDKEDFTVPTNEQTEETPSYSSTVTSFEQNELPKERNVIEVLQDKLNFASSNLEDISLVKICIKDLESCSSYEEQIEDLIFEVYKTRDLIFKTNFDEFTIIEPNTNIDSSIETANDIYLKLNDFIAEQQLNLPVNIGISSRSERIVSAEKFTKEAEQALLHSMQNKDSPIIAYRIDVQKYRNYLSSGEL